MEGNEYNFALLGPYAYVLAKERSDYEAIVRRKRYGRDWYKGIIFTHEDKNVSSLEDLRGKSFAFVDPSSASGYLFPKARMIDAGVAENSANFERTFSSMSFLGRHDRVVRAVYRGEFAAGATYKDARVQSGLPEDANPEETLPIIAETRRIPTAPIVVSEQFQRNNPELTRQLTQLLTNLHTTSQGQDVLEALGIDRYIRSEEGDYRAVEKVRETLREDG
jgi:phosphate/phosphite/phosphonate ABC transporter binding protein